MLSACERARAAGVLPGQRYATALSLHRGLRARVVPPEQIEAVGGELSMSPSGGSLKVLSSDLPLGLELLFDCMTHPAFPKDAFERMREQMLSGIEETEMEPDTRAANA